MIHAITSEAFDSFWKLRAFSLLRMNAFALIKNRNKSLTSIAKDFELFIPLGICEDVPTDVAFDIAQSTKVDIAMKIKALVENITFDSAQDAALGNVLSFLPIRRDGNGVAAVSVPDIIGGATTKTLINEAMTSANTLGIYEEISENIEEVTSHDSGHPLYVNVEIPYITGHDEIKYVKNTIGINIVIKKIKSVELKVVMSEHDPNKLAKSYMKVSNKEASLFKDFILQLDTIKAVAQVATNKDSLLNLVRKEKLRMDVGTGYVYPFTMFVVSDYFVETCMQEIKMNLNNVQELKNVMKSLLCLGFFIYSSNDSISYIYDGDNSLSTVMMSDFVTSASKYEKEIAQMIRLK